MEVLAPAGSFEKLKYAVQYGADAVYAAGKQFGLRAQSTNFSQEELQQAVQYCHSQGVKLYITVNIYAHNRHIQPLRTYLKFLHQIGVDAVIVSDVAIAQLIKTEIPELNFHVSTQANVTSWKSVEFWQKFGAKRVILARELTLAEIIEIRQHCPQIELEMFVHGAMCMAYSGRCLLSAYLNNRNANLGNCSQPCRWQYALTEATRPGQYFPIEEDKNGTYILNSKDLCLFDRLHEIHKAGIDSIKIEGRMKSVHYTATLTRAYRTAMNLLETGQPIPPELKQELYKISHRVYTEAFLDDFDSDETQNYPSSAYMREYQFLGTIKKAYKQIAFIQVKAKFKVGETIEIIFPDWETDILFKVDKILDEQDNPVVYTKPNTIVKLNLRKPIPPFGILRKKI
jgi:putative protease